MRILEHLPMLTTLALTLLLTLVLPQIMRRFRLPGVVGWILAGVLLGLAWIVRRALIHLGDSKANRAAIPLIAMVIAAQGAEWIELEGIIGAFLAGIAVKRGFGETHIEDSLEVMGQTLFIPLFFVASGFLVDFRVFYATLVGQPPLVIGIVGALLGGKWLAARLCGAIVGYPAADRAAMFALSVPQVAATLAVALVAYGARNTTGEHLIDQAIANAAIVLAVVTSLGGLLPAGRAAAAMSGPQPAAPKTPTTGQMAMWPLRRHVVPDMELP